jgi:hypothetical protein
VGTLHVTGGLPGTPYTFALAEGLGDDNNPSYKIAGDQLLIAHPLDFETRSIQRLRVRATDGSVTFERMLSILIQNNNDPPRCSIPQQANSTDDSGSVTLPGWVSACTAGEPLQFVDTSFETDDTTLFTTPPFIDASGTLTFDPAPNVRGRATVTVTLHDTGGTASFGVDVATTQFTIDIDKPHAWQNSRLRLDVTDDDHVVAGDALAIINYLNAFGAGELPQRETIEPPYYDTDGDRQVAPRDALDIIDAINAGFVSEENNSSLIVPKLAVRPSFAAIIDALAADPSFFAPAAKRTRR